jgi:hypothetical protein
MHPEGITLGGQGAELDPGIPAVDLAGDPRAQAAAETNGFVAGRLFARTIAGTEALLDLAYVTVPDLRSGTEAPRSSVRIVGGGYDFSLNLAHNSLWDPAPTESVGRRRTEGNASILVQLRKQSTLYFAP